MADTRLRHRPRPRPKKLFTCSCNETGVHPSRALNGGTSVVRPRALALWLVGLIFCIIFSFVKNSRSVIGWQHFRLYHVLHHILDFHCKQFFLKILSCSPLLLHTRGMLRPFLPPEQRACIKFHKRKQIVESCNPGLENINNHCNTTILNSMIPQHHNLYSQQPQSLLLLCKCLQPPRCYTGSGCTYKGFLQRWSFSLCDLFQHIFYSYATGSACAK